MIRVTVELLPGGLEAGTRLLGRATIANDLHASRSSNGREGAYHVSLSKWAPKERETWKRGYVQRFPRRDRRFGHWDLLFLALFAALGRERIADLLTAVGVPAPGGRALEADPDLDNPVRRMG